MVCNDVTSIDMDGLWIWMPWVVGRRRPQAADDRINNHKDNNIQETIK